MAPDKDQSFVRMVYCQIKNSNYEFTNQVWKYDENYQTFQLDENKTTKKDKRFLGQFTGAYYVEGKGQIIQMTDDLQNKFGKFFFVY